MPVNTKYHHKRTGANDPMSGCVQRAVRLHGVHQATENINQAGPCRDDDDHNEEDIEQGGHGDLVRPVEWQTVCVVVRFISILKPRLFFLPIV